MIKVESWQQKSMHHRLCEDGVLAGETITLGDNHLLVDISDSTCSIVVSDGVGGVQGGRDCTEFILRSIRNMRGPINSRESIMNNLLNVNECINYYAEELSKKMEYTDDVLKMGASVAGLFINDREIWMFWAGNTRIYKCDSNKQLYQMTEDQIDQQGRLLGAFGGGNEAPFIQKLQIKKIEGGNDFYITTDGIHDHVTSEVLDKMSEVPECIFNFASLPNGPEDDETIVHIGIR